MRTIKAWGVVVLDSTGDEPGLLNDLIAAIIREAQPATNDFRAHTCGECAWALSYIGRISLACRRVSWAFDAQTEGNYLESAGWVLPGEPACPAYVPRNAEEGKE